MDCKKQTFTSSLIRRVTKKRFSMQQPLEGTRHNDRNAANSADCQLHTSLRPIKTKSSRLIKQIFDNDFQQSDSHVTVARHTGFHTVRARMNSHSSTSGLRFGIKRNQAACNTSVLCAETSLDVSHSAIVNRHDDNQMSIKFEVQRRLYAAALHAVAPRQ